MRLILETIKALFRKVEAKIPKKLSDLANDLKFPTPDWNENDPAKAEYIKNRPFYESIKDKVLFDGVIIENENFTFDPQLELQAGMEYTAIFDGVPYTAKAYYDDVDAQNALSFLPDGFENYLYVYSTYTYMYTDGSSSNAHTLKVIQPNAVDRELLPDKYLPDCVVRSDVYQRLADDAQAQVRRNIGAITASDVACNLLWFAKSTSLISSTITVSLEKPNGFALKRGTTVIVPIMPGSTPFDMNGITLKVGTTTTAKIYNVDNSIVTSGSNAPWDLNGPALFYYTGTGWTAIPAFITGGTGRPGPVKLCNDVKIDTAYYAATAHTVKMAYDKAVEVESKAVLNEAKEFTLTSSTEGSTKKFKITVNDSGTIAAVEVTT